MISINIEIGGKKHKLSMQEAEELHKELSKIFYKPNQPSYPMIPPADPQWPPTFHYPIITC